MITAIHNDQLCEALKDRKSVLSTLVEEQELDDSQLNIYNRFQEWYNSLSQLDKDLFYLLSVYSVAEISTLQDCSKGYLFKKRNELREGWKNWSQKI